MKKRKKAPAEPEEQPESRPDRRRAVLTACVMILIFLFTGILYYVLISLRVIWVTPALYILAAVLFLTFFFVNRGFSARPPERDSLPPDWSEERKDSFLAEEEKRKRIARPIMIVMVPILLLVAADMIYLVLIQDLLS